MNIYALSSGRGPSGIAIIRISGKDTLKVCKNLTKLKEIKSKLLLSRSSYARVSYWFNSVFELYTNLTIRNHSLISLVFFHTVTQDVAQTCDYWHS